MTDFIRENSSQLLHYMNLPCLTSGYFILSYFPQLNYVFYKFCNYLYCHFDLCHVSELNDIIAYIALQKQPLLCGNIQRQKGTYLISPFFCYHSISFYICKLFQYQFLDRHKRISLFLQFINNQKCCIYR